MRITAIALVSFALLASCGPSVTDACNDYAKAWCTQQYKCQTGTTLANLQSQFGATADQCATVFGSCTTAQSPCAVGTSYDTGAAESCVTAYGAQSCADIQQNAIPEECQPSNICH